MGRYLISGYDKDHDIFVDYEELDNLEQALENFENYKDQFHSNELRSSLGELVDFIAIYDTETNDRIEFESWC